MSGFELAFQSAAPSFHPVDLLVGIACGLRSTSKGRTPRNTATMPSTARWGTQADIILTQTERLTMNSRPKDHKTAWNKNMLVIGGSSSGKTRYVLKPNLLRCGPVDKVRPFPKEMWYYFCYK